MPLIWASMPGGTLPQGKVTETAEIMTEIRVRKENNGQYH
jgi:hypothetical protein